MIRKQLYLDLHHDALLKKKAKAMGVTEAEVVRNALELFLKRGGALKKDLAAWEAEKNFILSRMKPGRQAQMRSWKREDLYDR